MEISIENQLGDFSIKLILFFFKESLREEA